MTTMTSPFDTFVPGPPATERQMAYLESLREQWVAAVIEREVRRGKDRATLKDASEWIAPRDRTEASQMIDATRSAVAAIRAETATLPAPARPSAQVAEGIYVNPATGAVAKVQIAVHGSGRPYAKLLDMDAQSFSYLPGGLKIVARDYRPMTLDEAKAFGKLYGVCCRCGRTLTDEFSIAQGIGPVCASRW